MSIRQELLAEQRVQDLTNEIYHLNRQLERTEDAAKKAEIIIELASLNSRLETAINSPSY